MNAVSLQRCQLEALCEHLTDYAVCFLDASGCIAGWNSGATRFYQIDEQAVTGHSATVLFTSASLSAALRQAFSEGQFQGEWVLKRDAGNSKVFVTIRPAHREGNLIGYTLLSQHLLYERKTSEQLINHQHAGPGDNFFEQLVEHSYSGISLFNEELQLIYRSPSAARITGFTDNARVGLIANDMVHPGDLKRIKGLLEELLQLPGESRTCQFRSRHFDGHFIHLECVFTNWLQEPFIHAIVLNFKDITNEKAAEDQLHQAIRELTAYKYALDEAAIVAVTDQHGAITHVNDYFCRISGYSREELLSQDHRIVNSGYHDKAYIRNLWRTIAQGQVWRGELCNRSKDGQTYWVATTIVPFLNEQGKPYQYMAIRFDITAAKAADEELHRKSEQISSLLEGITDGFLALDKELRYTYVNPRICEMVAKTPEEMLGRYIWDVFPDVVGSPTYHAIENAWRQQEPVVNEDYYAPLKLWQENRIYPGANGLSVFVSDISERKQAEREQALLHKTSNIFNRQESMSSSLKQVLHLLMDLSGAGHAEAWLNSAESGKLYLMANVSASALIALAFDSEQKIKKLAAGEGLTGIAWQTGVIQHWADISRHPDFLRKDAARSAGLHTALGIPLRNGGETLGVILLMFEGYTHPLLSEEFALHFSDHLAAEMKRKQLKLDFQQIFESVPDIICTVGDDRRYKRVNKAMCELLGYSEAELISMSIDNLIHPDDREESLLRTAMFRDSGRKTMYFQNRYCTKAGKIMHLDWSVRKAPERDILFCVGRDITEKKELEELLRKASELARIGSWELHPQTGMVYWSPLTREMLEVGDDFEMEWEKAQDFCPPPALERINNAIAEVIQGGDAFDVEINVTTGAGHQRWVRILGQGEFQNGSCTRVYGSVQDITVRKLAELTLKVQSEELAVSEKRYSELFHMSPMPLWVFDLETLAFLDVNAAAMQHYGYSRKEFLSMTIRDIRPAEEQPLLDAVLNDNSRSEHLFRPGTFHHIKKSGEIIEVEIVSSALHYQEKPARLALMFDVTERNRYLAEIEAQNKRLRDISWMQSHVIRAPLSRLMGLVDLLKNPLSLQEQEDVLNYIRISADELDLVIREITRNATA